MAGLSCRVVHAADVYQGKQGLPVFAGVSAETTGSQRLCVHLVTIPPGGRAKAHLHEHHESAIYLVTGQIDTWWGEGLAEHAILGAGDFPLHPRRRAAPAGQPQHDRAGDRGGRAHRS